AYASERTEVVKYGPKRSLAVIGRDADLRKAARALAHDACHYDQRACFSVQQAFFDHRIDLDAFLAQLREAMDVYKPGLPKGFHGFDEKAAHTLAISEAMFMDVPLYHDPGHAWAVAVCPPDHVGQHPLGRTLYLHPMASPDDVLGSVDEDVQTVA